MQSNGGGRDLYLNGKRGEGQIYSWGGDGVKSSTGEVLVADFLPAPFLMTERDRPRRGGLHSVM